MSAFKLKPQSDSGEFSVPPAGSHPAICVAVVDLGTQTEEYQGVKREARKVFLVWELTGEKDELTSCNFIVGRDYTASMHQKAALRSIVEKWRGRALGDDEEFDLTKLLGKPCLITLVHKQSQKDRTYAKIDAIGPLPKGMTAPPATLKPFGWEIEGGDVAKLPAWLPAVYGEKVTTVIARAAEVQGGTVPAAAPANEVNNDDLAEIF